MSPTPLGPKLLSWAPDLDPNAREQALRTAALPFVDGHVALMPDAHWGMGATIGSVIPTKGAIVPAAVGVDIGCGMIAARLDITSNGLPDNLDALHAAIVRAVPAGVGKGHDQASAALPQLPTTSSEQWWTPRLQHKAATQFGSLGSGNHFVEICLDEADQVWIVLHSGSRGVGNELAKVHIENAKALMRRYFIALDDPDLAYLVEGTPEFAAYIADMLWAQDYAMGNRDRMLGLIFDAVRAAVGSDLQIVDQVNCHHNFTQMEHHAGRDVWLTRKGAIRARTGDRGVIPGSMGTRSYVVSGLGNTASYCSCSHGAGRRLGRKEAVRQLSYESLVAAMEGKVWDQNKALLDEHPSAYKDIDAVMEAQQDLVTIDHTLHQILNYKGT